jgi:hypothetical protein
MTIINNKNGETLDNVNLTVVQWSQSGQILNKTAIYIKIQFLTV